MGVKIDLSGMSKSLDKAITKGQYAFANQVHADSNEYAPFLNGDLTAQSQVSADGKQIIWNVPYANRMYNGVNFNFTKTHNPKAGSKWDQRAQADKGEQWVKATQEEVDKYL